MDIFSSKIRVAIHFQRKRKSFILNYDANEQGLIEEVLLMFELSGGGEIEHWRNFSIVDRKHTI